jgi:hypothetical protein
MSKRNYMYTQYLMFPSIFKKSPYNLQPSPFLFTNEAEDY